MRGTDALGNFFLYHADNLGNQIPVFQNTEKDLRRDVIRKISDNRERFGIKISNIRFKKIPVYNLLFVFR